MKRKTKLISLFFVLTLLVYTASASIVPGTDPERFEGYATVDGSLASGANVRAYNGATYKETTTDSNGKYVLTAEGDDGDSITLKVYGVSINEGAQTFNSYAVTYLNITMTKSGSGGACTYGETWSSQGCTSGLTCCSDNTCKSSCDSGDSTSSGGGGGGGFVDYEEKEIQVYGTVEAGQTVSRDFGNLITTPIISISITPSITINGAEITVGEGEQPIGAVTAISVKDGEIYKYVEITKTGFTNDDLEDAEIQFKVPKTWFESKNTDPDTVELKRWTGSNWETLPTSKLGVSGSYYKYSAKTSGFSIFVITAKYKADTATSEETEQQETEEETVNEEGAAAEEAEEITTPTGAAVINDKEGGLAKSGLGIIIVSLIVVAGVIVYYVAVKKKTGPVKLEPEEE